ncbi:MAG TPA: hypothetical protein VK699_02900 [Terriglobales bacterium]|jgi:hypothetical protein|nr:hypothetical protein [Terriglobales bacterium]
MPEDKKQNPELASRLQKTGEELKQLSQDIKTGTVDVRVLVEFRKAMNNARHTAYAVEKWIQEEQKAGGNPFSVIAMVVEERMRIAMELAKDLTNDMQSGDLDLDTPGIKEFYHQMKMLVENLGRFVHEE